MGSRRRRNQGQRSYRHPKRRREARHLAGRIVELSEEGHSPAVIASSTGLTEEFVREALQRAAEATEDAEGGGELT